MSSIDLAANLISKHASATGPLTLPYTRGNPKAKIVFVGEAPGADEERAFNLGQRDTAFIGQAGTLVDSLLQAERIDPSSCYFTNVLKRRPPDNDITAITKAEFEQNVAILREELYRLPNAQIIVTLGNTPLNFLAGKGSLKWTGKKPIDRESPTAKIASMSGVGNHRGSIYPLQINGRTFKLIPTLHPALLLRQYKMRTVVGADLARIKEEADSPNPIALNYPSHVLHIRPTKAQVLDYIAYCHTQPRITSDLETEPLCLGIATSATEALTIPVFNDDGSHYWEISELADIWRAVHDLFTTHRGHVGHFLYFDIYHYHHYGWLEARERLFTNVIHDTFSSHTYLFAELPHSLQFLCSIYTRVPFYKEEGRKYNPRTDPIEQMWAYNAKDCVVTHECHDYLEEELTDYNAREFFNQYYTRLFPYLMQTMLRGMRVDEAKRSIARKEYIEKWRETQDTLQAAIGQSYQTEVTLPENPREWVKTPGYFNVKSNPQVNNLLKELGVNLKSTGEKYLKKARSTHEEARPIINLILEARKIRDVKSRYLDTRLGHEPPPNTRFHFTLKCATKSGRLASNKDPFNLGSNSQNVPDGTCRSFIIPDPGRVMGYADLSQAEARVVAYLADCEAMIREFETADAAMAARTICKCGSGKLYARCCADVHRLSASTVFRMDVKLITDDHRTLGKTLRHAFNYKIGPDTFALYTGIKRNVCASLLTRISSAYPEVEVWHRQIARTISSTRKLVNPLGRVRYFLDRTWDHKTIREAISYIPQSTIPDITNLAYMDCADAGIQILGQHHDALQFQCYIPDALDVCDFVKRALERSIIVNGHKIVIPADVRIGTSWSKDDLMDPVAYVKSRLN